MALLPKNQRDQAMVLVCFLAVALSGAYWYYVWSPKNETLVTLGARLDTLEARNARARAEMAKGTVAQLQAEADRHARDLEVMRQLVPTGNELPVLLEQVSTAARRQGLDLSAVEPQPIVEGDQFDTYRYKIAVTGDFHALGEFLASVGSLTRIVAPVNLSLSPAANPNVSAVKLRPAGTAAIDSRFEIQTYIIRTAPATAPAGGGN
jgi:type IV pilus assembly protein PilO